MTLLSRAGTRSGRRALARLVVVLALVVAIVAISSATGTGASAQAQGEWSTPTVVYRTDGYTTRPRLVADSSGDLHLLFFLREASDTATGTTTMIMYSRYHDGVWSLPVDVLVGAGTNSPTVTVDQRGFLHVVWEGGQQGELAYSRAHVSQAASARGWSKTRLLSEPNAFDSDILATDDGALRLVYSTRSGNVWYQESTDGGATWSTPAAVAGPETQGCTTNNPRLAVDGAGAIHVVWTELQLPSGWPPCGALYSDSLDRGRTWSTPTRIAGPGYGQISVLTVEPSTIFLAWNAMVGIGERRWTRSIDGGFAFAPAQYLAPRLRGGFTGAPSMATDSGGVIHLVTSVDRPRGESMAVYHMAWNGTAWTDPEHISLGAIGFRSVELPWIVASNGNQIHVVYEDDFQRIWHTYRSVSALPTPPRPVPTFIPESSAAPSTGENQVAQVASPTPDIRGVQPIAGDLATPRDMFLLGLAPVGAIIALAVVGRLAQRIRE